MIGRLPPSELYGISAAWVTATSHGVLGGPSGELPGGRPSLRNWATEVGIEGIRTAGANRLDVRTTQICIAATLALEDAGLLADEALRAETGILSTDRDGCVEDNARYYEDFVAGGRVLGRGLLFIRTLPTSAACEAAIRLGLQGPTLYLSRREDWLPYSVRCAVGSLRRGEARAMLVTCWSGDGALALLIGKTTSVGPTLPGKFAVSTAPAAVEALVKTLRERGAPVTAETR